MKLDKGIRIVACFEALKGLVVLCAGFGLLSMVNRDVQQIAVNLVGHFRFNPASRYPRVFLELAGNVSNIQLWQIASIAFAYAGIRLIEAYGLWHQRRWAEWFAIASGGVYVPLEVYELIHRASWIKAGTLVVNVGIVLYMFYVLKKEQQLQKTL
ncbi:MAG TPA: DUF2127 domain-containing protein [Methylophilaceae bacterium]|jgi:uncharacterized membrane protein (DUF2068 family)